MSHVRETCINVFENVMKVSGEHINDETSPETLFEWDSLSHVQLVLELEKKFSVEISPDQAIEFENFKMIVQWLENNSANN